MIRSPRERFSNSTYKDAWGKVVTSEAFEQASLDALLELQVEQPIEPTPNQAADSANRMIGARRYLEILCTIHRKQDESTKLKQKSLNYEAGV